MAEIMIFVSSSGLKALSMLAGLSIAKKILELNLVFLYCAYDIGNQTESLALGTMKSRLTSAA